MSSKKPKKDERNDPPPPPEKPSASVDELLGSRIVGGKLSELATYADLFIRTSDAIFLVHPQTFKILECNPSVYSLLGTPPEQVQGDSFLKWVHPSVQESVRKHLTRTARSTRSERPIECEMGNGALLELGVCRLKLADYMEVLQIIAKDITEVSLARRELEEINHRLEAASITDEMTQAHNFRHFMRELEKEHERSQRYHTEYSIVFCDVDHFKNYNDKNGHPAGDEVLREVSKILRSQVRKTDLVARYGGEEFVVLCPGTSTDKAMIVAEGLRKSIEEFPFAHAEKQPLGKVSMSSGVASYPTHGKDFKSVLQAADEAVYESKHAGRNRVTRAGSKSTKKSAA